MAPDKSFFEVQRAFFSLLASINPFSNSFKKKIAHLVFYNQFTQGLEFK